MKSKIVYDTRGKEHYFIDGKEVTKKEWKKTCRWVDGGGPPDTLMQTSKSWPRRSVSLEVDAKQKKEAEEHSIKIGVPTEYEVNETGGACPIIRDNQHQRELIKALGYVNFDGGYGQVTG